jgi:chromosome partitioning protein
MTRIYAFVNQKGGVGKTTTAINMGAYLAEYNQRVLLVDLDPQANATASVGINQADVERGSYDALLDLSPASEVVLRNPKLQLSLMPSSTALAGAQVEIVNMPNREKLMRSAIQPIKGQFDYILIDCPPSLGLLTVNALLAAEDGVIIPVQCEYLALEGLTQLMSTLRRVQNGLFPGLTIRGLLLTMYDSRTNLSQDVVDEVHTHFKDQVFKTIIPRSVRLAEAPSHGLPIPFYAGSSSGASAYREATVELLKGDGVQVTQADSQGVSS